MSSTSLDRLCRFCAQEQEQSIINLKMPSVRDKLRIFNKDIDFTNDQLPQAICNKCYGNLQTSFQFFVQLSESQDVFTQALEHCNPVIEKQQNTEPSTSEQEDQFSDSSLDQDQDTDPATLGSWSSYIWICAHCTRRKNFRSMNNLRNHAVMEHDGCNAFECIDCGEWDFGMFEDFVEHVRKHRPHLKDFCQYCDMRMDSPDHKHTGHICEYCGQEYKTQKVLRAHIALTTYMEGISDTPKQKKPRKDEPTVKKHKPKLSKREKWNLSLRPAELKTNAEVDTERDGTFNVDETELNVNENTEIDSSQNSTMDKSHEMDIDNNKTTIVVEKVKESQSTCDRVIQSWEQYPYICMYCDKEFNSGGLLYKHSLKNHKHKFKGSRYKWQFMSRKCLDCQVYNDPKVREKVISYDDFLYHIEGHRPYLFYAPNSLEDFRRKRCAARRAKKDQERP